MNRIEPVERMRWPHAVALWCLILACESVNGSLREYYLKPWLGTAIAKQLSFLSATILVLSISWLFATWLRATTTRAQLHAGAIWVVLTFMTEALLAHGLGMSTDAFLADYDPTRGGLMLFGLLVLLVAPKAGAWLHAFFRPPG